MDARLERAGDPVERDALVRQIDSHLGTPWVRLHASWSRLEPTQGVYSADELARLDALVSSLHGAGVKVLVTVHSVPQWASDDSWWSRPPASYEPGYQPFYPMRTDALDDFGNLGEFLALRYAGRMRALECWNEPNLWTFLYPQRTADDPYYASRVYLRMLKAFRAGVKRAGTGVPLVAGATAPVGLNDRYRTSPQRFARYLKNHGAASYFDAYSHHPYQPGGSLYKSPTQPPNDLSTTVTMYNLSTLLKLFPTKPFYLTEYGYNTRPSYIFGYFTVTKAQQATYLKQAYAMAARHRQVRALFWYFLYDSRPAGQPADRGVYTGLREVDGTRKASWYAFRAIGQ